MLPCVCLICTLVGAERGKAVPLVGKHKCSFGTCLKQILTATSFEWSYRGFKKFGMLTNSTNKILVNIQKPILSLFLWFPRRQDAFAFYVLLSWFSALITRKIHQTLNFPFLCWPPTLQSSFDICTCLSAESWRVSWTTCVLYLFTTNVLSAWSPLRMRGATFTLEPLAKVFLWVI